MIKLTSDLDFKLAKKRFGMMKKKHSRKRTTRTALLLLPVLATSVFMFCTELKKDDITEINTNPALRISYDDGRYADIPLAFSRNDSQTNRYYSSNGTPFTGTQSIYLKKNDHLDKTIAFENGFKKIELSYNRDGSEQTKIEYEYEQDFLVHKKTLFNNVLQNEMLFYGDSIVARRNYYENGVLSFEGIGTLNPNGIIYFNIRSQRFLKDGTPVSANGTTATISLPENQVTPELEGLLDVFIEEYRLLVTNYTGLAKNNSSREELAKVFNKIVLKNSQISRINKSLKLNKPAPPLPPEPEKLLANNQD